MLFSNLHAITYNVYLTTKKVIVIIAIYIVGSQKKKKTYLSLVDLPHCYI